MGQCNSLLSVNLHELYLLYCDTLVNKNIEIVAQNPTFSCDLKTNQNQFLHLIGFQKIYEKMNNGKKLKGQQFVKMIENGTDLSRYFHSNNSETKKLIFGCKKKMSSLYSVLLKIKKSFDRSLKLNTTDITSFVTLGRESHINGDKAFNVYNYEGRANNVLVLKKAIEGSFYVVESSLIYFDTENRQKFVPLYTHNPFEINYK